MSDRTDLELLQATRAGQLDAFEALLRRHDDAVRRRLDLNPKWQGVIDVDDIMQLTYHEAFDGVGRFEGDADAFPAWLTRIAQNNLKSVVEYLGRRKRPDPARRVGADDPIVDLCAQLTGGATTPTGKMRRGEIVSRLEAALDLLPVSHAEIVRLRYLDELSFGRIGEMLERPDYVVRRLHDQAIERLRTHFGPMSFAG